jgi:hypothetical protein
VSISVRGEAPGGISRREAIQWVMAAVAASTAPLNAFGQPTGRTPAPQEHAASQPSELVTGGYGFDPNLLKTYKPGDLWPLTFNDPQKKAALSLADVVLPRDKWGPAASELGVPAMIDEWISSPYPDQQDDRPVILEGLDWIDAEAAKRYNKVFADLSDDQKHAICDDICYTGSAKPQFRKAAEFFRRFRSIAASAYYATPAGWNAIGYVGNVPLTRFEGPPESVLKKLGVTQTVKDPDEEADNKP